MKFYLLLPISYLIEITGMGCVKRLKYKPLTPLEFKKEFINFDVLIANSFKFQTFHESFSSILAIISNDFFLAGSFVFELVLNKIRLPGKNSVP